MLMLSESLLVASVARLRDRWGSAKSGRDLRGIPEALSLVREREHEASQSMLGGKCALLFNPFFLSNKLISF